MKQIPVVYHLNFTKKNDFYRIYGDDIIVVRKTTSDGSFIKFDSDTGIEIGTQKF